MISTIPGRDIDPDSPPPESAPKLVSPAVLFMTSDEAPTGVVINAGGGRYYRAQIFVNDPINLGIEATFEDLMANTESLMDMSQAKPKTGGV